jgi:hypothetical protein
VRSLEDRTVTDTGRRCPYQDPVLGKKRAKKYVHGTRPRFSRRPRWCLCAAHQTNLRCNIVPIDQKKLYSVPTKYAVGESCNHHCEYKSNDWNGHWGEVLLMYNSRVILVTKERRIDSLLDDRVSVWTMALTTIQGLLLMKWGQYP